MSVEPMDAIDTALAYIPAMRENLEAMRDAFDRLSVPRICGQSREMVVDALVQLERQQNWLAEGLIACYDAGDADLCSGLQYTRSEAEELRDSSAMWVDVLLRDQEKHANA